VAIGAMQRAEEAKKIERGRGRGRGRGITHQGFRGGAGVGRDQEDHTNPAAHNYHKAVSAAADGIREGR